MSAPPIVYVVDDDYSVRKALERVISSVSLEVCSFATPAAFLAHPRADRPACLILDLRLPGSSGLVVQEQLARMGADLPIVFLTGYADVSTSVRAMKAGAFDFLQKPIDAQRVIDAVQDALGEATRRWEERAERARIAALAATLTPREREVLVLIVTGLPNKLVADQLGAAEKTVKVHRARVMEKMKATSLAELVVMSGLIGIPSGPRRDDVPSGAPLGKSSSIQ
jgi:RNA polymerase sigma factor (sigma-70 family)